jgi:hypothetical protein
LTFPGGAGAAEARDATLDGQRFDLIERRVHGGGVAEGGALTPALRLFGNHAHIEHGSCAVHAGGGTDLVRESQLNPDELDAGEPHVRDAPTLSP